MYEEHSERSGDLMVIALISPDQVVWVRALPGDIVLPSWARHFTPTVSLFTLVYIIIRVLVHWG